jgi:hypothetical protein
VSKVESSADAGGKDSRRLVTGIAWVLASFLLFLVVAVGPEYFHWKFGGAGPAGLALAACIMTSIIAVAIIGIVQIHRAKASDRLKAMVLVPSYLLVAFYLLMLSGMFI